MTELSLIDLSSLRLLAVLCEEPSLAAAGERLGLTQQAVSVRLRKLEAEVGRPLVERRSAGARLTADGEVLLRYAKRAIRLSDDIRRQFADAPDVERLRLGVVEDFVMNGLTLALAALRSEHPWLEVSVMTGSSRRLEAAFDNGALDLVVALQPSGAGRGEVLATDGFRWFGAAADLDDAERPIPLAVLPQPNAGRDAMCDALAATGRPFRIVFESESRTSLRSAVVSGLAFGAFCFQIDADLKRREVAPGRLPALNDIDLILREGRAPAASAMADFLRRSTPPLDALGELPAGGGEG